MASPDLPPDPYAALGVAKDATGGAIKTQYRKLVLKFHPDKVQDDDQKKMAADEFHKIQTAYEIVGDEDKRARYDAQCKLAELRRDVMERQGAGRDRNTADLRSPTHKTPTEAPRSPSFHTRPTERHERTSPTYEERRPSYATRDYFEPPRPSSRKTPEYERSSKRAAPRDDRERTKTSAKEVKKSERATREERNKKATKEMRRERDRKPSYVEDDSFSEADEYERQTRRMREEEARDAREAYNEQARRQREEASHGVYDADPRAKKLFSQEDDARMYIGRSSRRPDSERRPSPVRKASSKDKVSYARGKDGRPTVIRRDSMRPRTSGRESESRRTTGREGESRRPSVDVRSPAADMMEDARPERRPPTLNQSKSSPIDVRPLFAEKQRAQSLQMDRDDFIPQMRRSETMPNSPSVSRERDARRHRETAAPSKSSHLRQTEFQEGIATPGATPEYTGPNPATNKYPYGHKYADDGEYPTPDGYRTEIREPASAPTRHAKYNRSPSPDRDRERERERERERGRGASEREKMRMPSARYPVDQATPRPTVPGRTTSTTSYVVTPTGVEPATMSPRPGLSRENSGRGGDGLLYGEVPIIRPPNKTQAYRRSPPLAPEGQRYQVRPEDLKAQAGYNYARRPSEPRPTPSYTRQGSNPVYVR